VRDVSVACATSFSTTVLTPRVRRSAVRERLDGVDIIRFPYFWSRFEDVADGATFENVRARPSRVLQLPFLMAAQVVALHRTIRHFKPDVLHIYWIIPQGLAALVVGRRRPWVVTSPGVDVYALNGRAWSAIKRAVIRRARLVTTMNADMRDRLVALGAREDKVVVLPMPADLERVRSVVAPVKAIEGRILFAGRLVEKKGLAVLLDALSRAEAAKSWTLHVVGDGPLRDELTEFASNAGPSVVFLGELSPRELARQYGEAAVVVVPSVPARSGDQDGLPVVLLEAMAAGRPVIASRLPGIAEAITDGTDGVLVPPGDSNALRHSLLQLMADPNERERLGANAARRADAFGIDAVGGAYVRLLKDVVTGR
jgi:glycosyltransferase involved in cell wall biosynthesis